MEEWLRLFFDWLPNGPVYYLLAGILALLESLTGIGLLVPGSALTVFAGFLVYHGKGELLPLCTAAATGALLGDLLSYWLGARLGGVIVSSRLLRRRTELLRRAEVFFAIHGGKSIFFGRFLGPLRGLIPFVAGGTRMRPAPFLLYTLVSAILWGAVYPGLGFLGGASWEKAQQWSGRFGLGVALLLLLFILNALLWPKISPHLARWFARKRMFLLFIATAMIVAGTFLLLRQH